MENGAEAQGVLAPAGAVSAAAAVLPAPGAPAARLAPLRPFWLLLPLGLLFLASVVRLVQLQIFPDRQHIGSALQSVHRDVPVEAPRADLLGIDGQVLAQDVQRFRLVLDCPSQFRRNLQPGASRSQADAELRPIFQAAGLDPERLIPVILDPDRDRYAILSSGLSSGTARRVQERLNAVPGTGMRLEPYWERVYPQGSALGQILGLTRIDPDAHGPERHGVFGLEQYFDAELRGQDGYKANLVVGSQHGANPLLAYVPAKEAPPVPTTLDPVLAQRAREELAEVMAEHRPEWASAVVVDCRTGDLLAALSLPDFNPNPGMRRSVNAQGEAVGVALPGLAPVHPGSTFKPFVVARALECGAIRDDETFDQEGQAWHLGSRVIHNTDHVPDRPLDWRGVLVHSSNIGAGKIGLELGAERLRAVLADFGFWEMPLLKPLEYRVGQYPAAARWEGEQGQVYTIPSVSMGHQITLTPLRLAYAYAALVNGGELLQPRLRADQPVAVRRRVIQPETSQRLREALVEVVSDPDRTWLPRWDDLAWGGKSGTADLRTEVQEDGYTSLFVAFAPAAQPTAVAVVVVHKPTEHGYFGSQVAGPAAGAILRCTVERIASRERAKSLASPASGVKVAGN